MCSQVWKLFVVTKQLTKMPHEYGNADSLPHVMVAKRMQQQNRRVQAGQVIEYLVVEARTRPFRSLLLFSY